jgi:hypothetical protein
MAALKIKYKNPHQLKPRARNPRTHTAKQIKQIAASIKEFGFISPILIDGADGIIAGHGRAEASKTHRHERRSARLGLSQKGGLPFRCFCHF